MNQIKGAVRGQLLEHELLAKYTSWRVGGVADRMYIPEDKQDLQQFITGLSTEEQVFWLGLGSNILIRDGGIRGTVITVRGKVKKVSLLDNARVYVECGVPCAHIARFCSEQGLSGAEFFAGIPGTMGGALKMNAGAFGAETWDLVESVEMIPVGGEVVQCNAEQFDVAYRVVKGAGNACFLSAVLQLTKDPNQTGQKRVKKFLARRATTQPTNLPSCGSVFRNPANDFAARLIEASGLKGYSVGGAEVSEKHANFIINTGGARAKDIEQLIKYVQREVAKQQGVKLHTEVCIVGENLA